MNFDNESPLNELLPIILDLEDREEVGKLSQMAGKSQKFLLEGKEDMHDAIIFLIKERLELK